MNILAEIVLLSLTISSSSLLCDAFSIVQSTTTSTTTAAMTLRTPPLRMESSSDSSNSDSDSSNSDSDSDTTRTIQSVTVVGGTGFVGSRVCKLLSEKGIHVISISKSGTIPDWLSKGKSTSNNDIVWKSIDLLNCSNDELDVAMGQPDALISCVGTIGTNPDVLLQGNGVANVNAFESAERTSSSSLKAIAYVSVSSEVKSCAAQETGWLPAFFDNYFKAKNMAEQSARQNMNDEDGNVIIVSPTFIYGGDSFGLLPPRVNDAYGSFIDQLLSFGIIQKLADVSPGLIKVALRPPVSVDAVAGACVNGILKVNSSSKGTTTILDTAKDINTMANQKPATGINDAIDFTIQTATETTKWIQEKVKEFDEKQKQNK